MSTRKTKRTKIMDVLFIIDATGSMQKSIDAAHDKAEDLAFELQIHNRTAAFKFGCICYRDPVDKEADQHQFFDFDKEIENLATFLSDVKATGGGDGPEDFVGALEIALNKLSWREGGKRAIIWIADAPAHGKRYCGSDNHQEEEPKLEPLVEKLGRDHYYFVGLSLNGGADRTFSEMRNIYNANGGQSFKIESFCPEKGNELERIKETMKISTINVVSEAINDFE